MKPLAVVRLAALALAALLVAPVASRAATPAADELMAKLEAADPTLESYRAHVEFSVGLHTFPYLRKTVHGDAYFKRPSRMEIVFTDLPGFAQRFKNLYVGLGTPSEWNQKFDIDASTSTGPDGRTVSYLIMTPKKLDRRLQHVDVYVDPASSLPSRIVWVYRDGRIEMKQTIVPFEGHNVIAAQNADIRLPGVHAFVNATIANYAINVPIDDAVFTKKPSPQPQP